MTNPLFARPGRYRREVTVRLAEEYGPREDWPTGLEAAANVLLALDERLPRPSYTRVLAALWHDRLHPGTPPAAALRTVDEAVAFAALSAIPAALPVPDGYSMLLHVAGEVDDERSGPGPVAGAA
ncbi:hypothetical protein ABT354_20240 [Streptomyces sp. NPDC000594]|uniref:hypothetical protein n=1 Tax=Streptomyces sp. NPDC000594 TaxID=3154261 RepID=UPI0033302C3D